MVLVSPGFLHPKERLRNLLGDTWVLGISPNGFSNVAFCWNHAFNLELKPLPE